MANNKKFISFENLKQFKTELDKKNLRVKANVEADLGETSLTFTAPNGENYKYEKFQ